VKHYPVHLKLDAERDVTTHHLKRRKVHILKMEHGGHNCGDHLPDALCGTRNVKRLVGLRERERVTCASCKRLMLVRFPKPSVNPRSGMRMPRPTATTIHYARRGNPACGSRARRAQLTSDIDKVTCQRCERSADLRTLRERARIHAEQLDICPECRNDASVPHLTGCSRGAFPS